MSETLATRELKITNYELRAAVLVLILSMHWTSYSSNVRLCTPTRRLNSRLDSRFVCSYRIGEANSSQNSSPYHKINLQEVSCLQPCDSLLAISHLLITLLT